MAAPLPSFVISLISYAYLQSNAKNLSPKMDLAALAVDHGADRERRQQRDRDQDREERRGAAATRVRRERAVLAADRDFLGFAEPRLALRPRRPAPLAMSVAVRAAPSAGAASVLSFGFVFVPRFGSFRSSTSLIGLIGRDLRFRTAFRLGMLVLDAAVRNVAAAPVLDTARITDFRLSERRSASKCQQSQH